MSALLRDKSATSALRKEEAPYGDMINTWFISGTHSFQEQMEYPMVGKKACKKDGSPHVPLEEDTAC